jgi:putative methionine-R-sulfoxide reductase with GAF domain
MEDACSLVKTAACQLLRASSATLYLVDQQRMLAWAYVSNSSELHRIPFGHGIVGRMAQGSGRSNGGSKAASSLVYNSSEEEDASVLCIGITDPVNESITAVLDIRRPRWSPQDKSLPFTEHDECVALSLGHTAGALIDHVQQKETQGALTAQLHNAALAEEKMASIITWLFEVIGSGDSDEHREEIEEMRDTFIRAHYGSRQQVEEMQILEDGAQVRTRFVVARR